MRAIGSAAVAGVVDVVVGCSEAVVVVASAVVVGMSSVVVRLLAAVGGSVLVGSAAVVVVVARVVVGLRLAGGGVGPSKSSVEAAVVVFRLLGFVVGIFVVVLRSNTSSGFLNGTFNAALNNGFFSPRGSLLAP